MYNLIVSSLLHELAEDEPVEVSRMRFLEYTSEPIKTQLRSLSTDALEAIASWPALIMEEGRTDQQAYVARIIDILVDPAELRLKLQRIPSTRPILNDDIWKIRDVLSIEQFEFSRHHWAIKEADLVSTCVSESLLEGSVLAQFRPRSLPAASRAEVLSARKIIGEWGHTEIDDLLLEVGIAEIGAGKSIGSRRDRANAIARYVLENPAATTAENRLLSAFIIEAARRSQSGEPAAEFEPEPNISAPTHTPQHNEEPETPNRVFVVHGRDEAAREEVVRYLGEIGLVPIVLHEQPNMGRHLLTKFIEEAELVPFAVVLMTADDVGGLSQSDLRPRARQNVILELGYFLSHLGQARVCALITPGLETPSDFDGVVYIQIEPSGRWKMDLRRELVAARMPIR